MDDTERSAGEPMSDQRRTEIRNLNIGDIRADAWLGRMAIAELLDDNARLRAEVDRLTAENERLSVCQSAAVPPGHEAVMLPTSLVAGRARMVGFYGMGTFADVIATACATAIRRARPCLCATAADIGAPDEYGGDKVIAHVHPDCPLHGASPEETP